MINLKIAIKDESEGHIKVIVKKERIIENENEIQVSNLIEKNLNKVLNLLATYGNVIL